MFLDKLFKPRRMCAVDIVHSLWSRFYTTSRVTENRFVHFGTSQQDGEVLKQFVLGELADELDLVVDDASRTYEETKTVLRISLPVAASRRHLRALRTAVGRTTLTINHQMPLFPDATLCPTSCSNKLCCLALRL